MAIDLRCHRKNMPLHPERVVAFSTAGLLVASIDATFYGHIAHCRVLRTIGIGLAIAGEAVAWMPLFVAIACFGFEALRYRIARSRRPGAQGRTS